MSYQQHQQQQSHAQEMYHEHPSARSPGSQRHPQPLHRQPSRQFDAYGPMSVNFYDEPMARYDTGRLDRLNPSLQESAYAYDLAGSQTWNPNSFSNPQALGGIRSASSSLKTATSRGRAGLPTVRALQCRCIVQSSELCLLFRDCILMCPVFCDRLGSISNPVSPYSSPPSRRMLCPAVSCVRRPHRRRKWTRN